MGLNPDDEVWDPTVFSKNRDRMMAGEVSQHLLESVLRQASEHQLLSEEHFTVDGTLIAAWASRKSFQPKDPPPEKGRDQVGENCYATRMNRRLIPKRGCTRRARRASRGPAIWGMC